MKWNLLYVRLILLVLFLFSCETHEQNHRFLPKRLPSEDSIKRTLSSDENLMKLRSISQNNGVSLESWKEREKLAVTESEISNYWKLDRNGFTSDSFDTDAIEKRRDSIRIRLAWSRIFQEANLSIKEVVGSVNKNLLSRLELKSSPRFGVSRAKWIIIEWSDFNCTFCKQTNPYTQKVLKENKERILYYHKDFPLDPESKEGITPLAISRCLWEKEPLQYLSNTQLLYDHVRKMTRGEFLGLSTCHPDQLKPEFYEKVQRDYREAQGVGITSIPTFWVNGRWVVGSLDEKSWARLLRDTTPK